MGLAGFVGLATLRLTLGDPFYYLLGRHYGAEVAVRLERTTRRIADLRIFRRTRCSKFWERCRRIRRGARLAALLQSLPALAVLLRPIGRNLAFAGARNDSPWLIGILDLVGTAVYAIVVYAGVRGWG